MRLTVEDLVAGYGRSEILHRVSLSVSTGQIATVIGANGAGKTTLLNTLAGLIKPTSGRVSLGGRDLLGTKPHQRVEAGLVLVPEGRHLFANMSVRENLALAERIGRRRGSDFDTAAAIDLFPALGRRMTHQAVQLSGGEQQMVAIARAMMLRPDFILLDEPSTGLAPRLVREVLDAVKAWMTSDLGVLLVEQNAVEAMRVADIVYVLANGVIVREATPDTVATEEELRTFYLG